MGGLSFRSLLLCISRPDNLGGQIQKDKKNDEGHKQDHNPGTNISRIKLCDLYGAFAEWVQDRFVQAHIPL